MNSSSPNQKFPPVEFANPDGLLAMGGDLSVERLLEAYNHGIFPWYDESEPILWWSPDPRMVLLPENLKISKSMKKLLKNETFRVTYNQDFNAVIEQCSTINRNGQDGTWITKDIKDAYLKLHHLGIVQSVEVWQNEKLVGGLYGIYLKDKHVFCGESMFSKVSNASKYGFISYVRKLKTEGVKLVDCQMYTKHLESLGANEIPRNEFLKYLE